MKENRYSKAETDVILEKLVLDPKTISTIKAVREKLMENDVYIYGSGNAGCLMYDELISNGYNVTAFLDRSGDDEKTRFNKHIYRPTSEMISEHSKKSALVIVSLLCSMEEYYTIKKDLFDTGFKDVRFYFPLHNSLDLVLHERLADIKEALSLLADDKSKKILMDWVEYIACLDKTEFDEEPNQYFPEPYVEHRYKRFIDCGAFTGDTYLNLKERVGTLDAYACFEADACNFEKVVETVSSNNISKTNILFPMAVWNKTETLRFNSLNAGSGTITNIGETYIQAASIDECIPDFAPTFIKMDVEGAEMKALEGAKKTIVKYCPDIAVCVYHRFSHLWECISYLNGLSDKYAFYLRCHSKSGQETVLYAIKK